MNILAQNFLFQANKAMLPPPYIFIRAPIKLCLCCYRKVLRSRPDRLKFGRRAASQNILCLLPKLYILQQDIC